jgi:hypothetical protein
VPGLRAGYKYCGALHLRGQGYAQATNIAVRCTLGPGLRAGYKYCGALHLRGLGYAQATNIAVRCTLGPGLRAGYKYCGALHLEYLRISKSSGAARRNICSAFGNSLLLGRRRQLWHQNLPKPSLCIKIANDFNPAKKL